jgi:ankyrin repeat protein
MDELIGAEQGGLMNLLKTWSALVLLAPMTTNAGNLEQAAKSGDLAKVLDAIQENIDVDARDPVGMTALLFATWYGHLSLIQVLLNAKADVNAASIDGWSALQHAAYRGSLEIVQELLNAKADVNSQNKCGYSALMWASSSGHQDVVQLLLKAGADINEKSFLDGLTAIKAGRNFGRANVIAFIKEWSIPNQIRITGSDDLGILDAGNLGSFQRRFDAHGEEIKKILAESDIKVIPRPHPMSIIEGYVFN